MTARNAAKQQVNQLIESQLYFANALEGLLQSEYSALIESDVGRLTQLVALKMDAASSLEEASLALHDASGGTPGALVEQFGAETAERWSALGDSADRLRSQNLVNGAVINEHQSRLRYIADSASGEPEPIYGSKARHPFGSGLSGRSLARV